MLNYVSERKIVGSNLDISRLLISDISDKTEEVRGAGQADDVLRPDGPRVRHQWDERQAGAAVQRSGHVNLKQTAIST